MKIINTVGVVGAGTMGAALAQKFAQEGFMVILSDRDQKFVENGLTNIRKTLDEAIERKIFSKEKADEILIRIKGSYQTNDLKECDLVVECIFEDINAKKELFGVLSNILDKDCIVATNTSSFSVTELAKSISNPGRFIGLHFFYHAAKNRLVEIIPCEMTSEETMKAAVRFSIAAGKDPIFCRDIYGFAVNRYFVPWLNEAVRLYEEGVATKEEIDFECMSLFGIGMGPFALMNATGIKVAYHAEKTLEIFGKLYEVCGTLKKQAESGDQWNLNMEPDKNHSPANSKTIRDRMLGIIFFVCSQMLDEGVCSCAHLNRGAKIGLRWKKGPAEIMNSYGAEEVNRIIKLISDLYQMKTPKSVGYEHRQQKHVLLEIINENAIITLDQPENLNALSEVTVNELSEKFELADSNENIKTIFITGTGKAFAAGADIKFFVKNIKSNKIDKIKSFTEFCQNVFNRIDNSQKKIVAVVNGLTLGGGLELALCADLIIAYPKAQFAFPETGIGIYPGLGGTQRTVKKIGKGLSKYLIHTGKMITASEAEEMGLVDKIISADELTDILSGKIKLPDVSTDTLNDRWRGIRDFFDMNSLEDILSNSYKGRSLESDEAEKISKSVSLKAPIAIKYADKLIEEAGGCESELLFLTDVFSTSDALLGLTSIGKNVKYQGK